MTSDRYQQGWETLRRIDEGSGERILRSLEDVAPDFARLIIEFPYGDVYARPGLDLQTRMLLTIAALTTRGDSLPQLKVHVGNALNVGCTQAQIVETIMQMAVYAGFPPALNAMLAAAEVFRARQNADRSQ